MAQTPVYVAENTPVSTSVGVDVIERASPNISTTTTADPGSGGTTLAVTLRDRFPQTAGFKIRVLGTSGVPEIMLVTGGVGTGAGSFTVTRGVDGTVAAAQSVGATVALMTAVQRVEPVAASKQVSYLGRVATFRTPGRAGTTGQKIFALHNATASPVLVDIDKVTVDLVATVVKAVTVLPPVIRAWKFTAVPTSGTAGTKVPEDTNLSSSSSLTVWQDASADGTSSGTALTVTLPAGTVLTEEFAPRLITAAGYEMFDRTTFFEGEQEVITLRPLEGICVFLDYVLATQNPVTDMWTVAARWIEYLQA